MYDARVWAVLRPGEGARAGRGPLVAPYPARVGGGGPRGALAARALELGRLRADGLRPGARGGGRAPGGVGLEVARQARCGRLVQPERARVGDARRVRPVQ